MERKEQVKICSQCLNRAFDPQVGVICGLTGSKADFENECLEFKADATVKEKPMVAVISEKEQAHKDMLYGALWCMAGLAATAADIGYIFYGAVLFGGIQFIKGASNS